MPVTISDRFTKRVMFWSDWTAQQIKRRGIYQSSLENGQWTIWFYDSDDCFIANIWVGAVPPEQIVAGYSQAQNDSDLANFLSFWEPDSNRSLSAHEMDGRNIVAAYPASLNTQTQFTGTGDDVAGGIMNGGPALEFVFSGSGTQTVEIQFLSPVQLADGAAIYSGTWDARDRISFGVRMPANTVTPNPGNTGNCNLMPVGPGMNMIVPADGDGAYDINLATAVPVVTNIDGDGQSPWWTDPTTGDVEAAPRSDGNSLLLDFEKEFWLVSDCPIGASDGHWDIDVYRAEYIHQRWFLKAEVIKTSSGAGVLSGEVLIYRMGNLGL